MYRVVACSRRLAETQAAGLGSGWLTEGGSDERRMRRGGMGRGQRSRTQMLETPDITATAMARLLDDKTFLMLAIV